MFSQKPRLGYWLTERKLKKPAVIQFLRQCDEAGIQVVAIHINDLHKLGPFHIILHNATDLLARWRDGDRRVGCQLHTFKRYLCDQPAVQVLDPLSAVRRLTNRFKTYILIRKQLAFEDVQVPAFALIREQDDHQTRKAKVRNNGLVYPLLAKPKMAQNHQMLLIYNEDGLRNFEALNYPVVLQTFIPHGGILHKIYVIGDRHQIVVRPSVRDQLPDATRANVPFATAEVSRVSTQSILHPPTEAIPEQCSRPQPDPEKVRRLIAQIVRLYHLTLFGVDLILENGTGRHFVIDVNFFPGYDGMKCTADLMFAHVRTLLQNADVLPSSSQVPSTASEKTETDGEHY